MATHPIASQNFLLYACLPFVELASESIILFGPVAFWPASKSPEFLSGNFPSSFEDYLQGMAQIKAHCQEENAWIKTRQLNPSKMTCISIAESIPVERRAFLLIDSLYLLYFACIFRHLYYGHEIPSFHPFRKLIPASKEFIQNQQQWEGLHLNETDREETISLHIVDPDICEGLGKALEAIYLPTSSKDPESIRAYKRLIRAIRYLIDRFFQRFVNLVDQGLHFSEEIFEPEDIIFLVSSFESLFYLDNSQAAAADFKHKLRPLLHLKYSRPVEIFWKWVDDFYEVKRRILQGDTFIDPLFRRNPNFEISHILLGIKLFVYAVYYYLFKYQLLQSTYVDPYTPPDFKWIHPEEILLFFWTESSVLEKINFFIKPSEQERLKEEALAEMSLLTTLFVALYDRYYLSEQVKGEGVVRFIPSPLADLSNEGKEILEKLKEIKEKDPQGTFLQFVHPYFINVLEDRLEEKKIHPEIRKADSKSLP
jgi:hypothetical protein